MTESLCDTISIFATDSVAQTETQTPFYEDMGFFQGDSLMHPEVKAGHTGFEGVLRPYRLLHDDWVTLSVLLCFVLLVVIQKRIRSYIVSQAKEFFLPSKNITRKENPNNNSERFIPLLLMLVISIMGGLGVFDIVGGGLVGLATAGACAWLGKHKKPSWLVALPIALIPALVVSVWLSALLGVPYPAMAASLLVGQAICGAVGALLVSALRYVWKEK